MKLVYLSNSDIPSRSANSVHVMKMCSAFTTCGFDVHLAATNRLDGDTESMDPFSYYGVERNFKITRIPWFGKLPGKYYIYALMSALWAVLKRPDVLYGRYLFGVYMAAKLGKTVTLESHSDEFNRSKVHTWMIKYLAGSKRCKNIVLISEALRQAYREAFPEAKDKLFVAHDGADPKPSVKTPSNKRFTAGYMGHLYRGKGMEIIEQLAAQCPDVHFLIVGGLEEDLNYWTERLKDQQQIEFTGYVPHHQTDQYLQKMDVALAPYLKKVHVHNGTINISRWMSPLKIFEYMAAGKPMVASDLPVIGEVLKSGKNAILCNPDKIADWVNAIQQLKDNPEQREQLGRQARIDFEATYTWKKRAEKIKELLV